MDLGSLFGDAQKMIEDKWEEAKKVAVPTLQNAAEQWAANVLDEQKTKILEQNKQTQATLNRAVQEVMNAPSEPGSFGSFLTGGLKGAAMQNYGLYIILGVIGVAVVGFIVMKK